MSEIPERIEREMFEIRSRMAPDVVDLKQHVSPKAVSQRVTTRLKNRVRSTLTRFVGGLKDSARQQARMAQEAGRKRDPAMLTDAVKRDPRPLIVLAVALAATLFTVRRINGNGG